MQRCIGKGLPCSLRNRLVYTWKVLEGLVPDWGVKEKQEGRRCGRKCEIPSINWKAKKSVHTLREQTFQVNGPKLYNILTANVRNMTKCSIDDFKMKLDKFLEGIPDGGLPPGACTAEARASTSLLDQVRRVQMANTHVANFQRGG